MRGNTPQVVYGENKMGVNNVYAVIISVTTLILIVLSSILATTVLVNSTSNIHTAVLAQASADNIATITILPSIGGTTNMSEGTYNITVKEKVTLTAIPSEGFFFKYWVISGYVTDRYKSTVTDMNITSTNPITITCAQGDIYRLQAVFTSNPDVTLDNLPRGVTFTKTTDAIIFLVGISLVEATILGVLYVRCIRKKCMRQFA